MKRLVAMLLLVVMLGSTTAFSESIVMYAPHNGISICCRNGKYGFVRDDGEELHPPVFDEVNIFRNNCSIVCKNGLWGAIDKTGENIVPYEYDYVELAYSSETTKRFIVSNAKGTGILNEVGEPICELIYDSIRGYHNELAIVEFNGLLGLIDLQGDLVVSPQWEWIYYMTDGWALVSFEQEGETRYSFVDSKNERMEQTYLYAEPFSEGVAFVMDEDSANMISPLGKPIFDISWDDIHFSCSQGLIGVCKNGLWGYCSNNGDIIISPTWHNAMPFAPEGLASVKVDDKYGYIDECGRMIIEPFWATASDFSNGYAIVSDGNHYGLIDKSGSICIPPIWNDLQYPSEGLVAVQDSNGLWGFVDLSGKQQIDFCFSFVLSGFENGCALVIETESNRQIWINSFGEVVCP